MDVRYELLKQKIFIDKKMGILIVAKPARRDRAEMIFWKYIECHRCLSESKSMNYNDGEFDPGSGRTLAAWIRHASRTVGSFRASESGERVSNA